MKTYLQNGSENRQFSKSRSFTSRGLLIEKSVFLTGHVLQTASMFLQNWLIYWFQVIADALTVPPKKRVPGASTQWRNWSKIRRRRRRRDLRTDARFFKRVHFTNIAHISTISCSIRTNCVGRWIFTQISILNLAEGAVQLGGGGKHRENAHKRKTFVFWKLNSVYNIENVGVGTGFADPSTLEMEIGFE